MIFWRLRTENKAGNGEARAFLQRWLEVEMQFRFRCYRLPEHHGVGPGHTFAIRPIERLRDGCQRPPACTYSRTNQ